MYFSLKKIYLLSSFSTSQNGVTIKYLSTNSSSKVKISCTAVTPLKEIEVNGKAIDKNKKEENQITN